MMEEPDQRQMQRNFYLALTPLLGHEIAKEEAGFTPPSDEIGEAEVKDVLESWFRMSASGAGEVIANCAWWMTQLLDPDKMLGAAEGTILFDRLSSFAVSILRILVDQGIVAFTREHEVPDFLLSSEQSFSMDQLDFLSFLEQFMEGGDHDE